MRIKKATGKRIFRFRIDRRSRRITTVILVLIAAAFALFRYYTVGLYLPAWFLLFVLAVAALFVLSIPRYIRVGNEAVEIRCLLESTYIHFGDLKAVRLMEPGEMKFAFPLLASYGFFGYYGYYLNLRRWEVIKVYASRWSHFVEIEDIYEQKYIVSADNPGMLAETIHEVQQRHRPSAEASDQAGTAPAQMTNGT